MAASAAGYKPNLAGGNSYIRPHLCESSPQRTPVLYQAGASGRAFAGRYDDVSSAFIAAARYAGPHRVMNVGSGHGRSLNQVVSDVRAVLG